MCTGRERGHLAYPLDCARGREGVVGPGADLVDELGPVRDVHGAEREDGRAEERVRVLPITRSVSALPLGRVDARVRRRAHLRDARLEVLEVVLDGEDALEPVGPYLGDDVLGYYV